MPLNNALSFSHQLLEPTIQLGDTVVDATVGQGNDTRFLAARVGKTGHVLAFDIQQAALDETATMLTLTGLRPQVALIHDGHEHLVDHINDNTMISAAMFNLGYLPGGDHSLITRGQTTIAALQTCCDHLRRGGLITIVVYTGHPGGQTEADLVTDFVRHLPQKQFQVLHYGFINQQHQPPYLLAIEKR
ncbi:class I SAM-dependent methyltransferase [Furfurilactobacillus entadae]|uniref:class I SAM-dependent methyltransferase n=1 Tax=Furfurilactobacillus entadae TaxID=2922307 RepID=UPI0035EBBCCC